MPPSPPPPPPRLSLSSQTNHVRAVVNSSTFILDVLSFLSPPQGCREQRDSKFRTSSQHIRQSGGTGSHCAAGPSTWRGDTPRRGFLALGGIRLGREIEPVLTSSSEDKQDFDDCALSD